MPKGMSDREKDYYCTLKVGRKIGKFSQVKRFLWERLRRFLVGRAQVTINIRVLVKCRS